MSSQLNPYQPPQIELDPPIQAFEKGAFQVQGLTIVGGGDIWLPPVCVVSGSVEDLEKKVTKLKCQSIAVWIAYYLALIPLLWAMLVKSSVLSIFGLSLQGPMITQFSGVALSVIILLIIYSWNRQASRTTQLHWYLSKKEVRAIWTFRILVLLLFVVLIRLSSISRGVNGFIPFLAIFAGIYGKNRFAYPKLIERRQGFSRVSGFKPAFFKSLPKGDLLEPEHSPKPVQ